MSISGLSRIAAASARFWSDARGSFSVVAGFSTAGLGFEVEAVAGAGEVETEVDGAEGREGVVVVVGVVLVAGFRIVSR